MLTPIARAALLALSGLPAIAFAQSQAGVATSTQSSAVATAVAPTSTDDANAPATEVTITAPAAANASGATAASAAPAAQSAATPVATLDPIVVTAKRAPEQLSDAVPQTTVFTAKDIAESGAPDLPSLLALAPGVQVTGAGVGSVQGLFMRGASSSESLVLVDGVRMDSLGVGMSQFGQVMLDQVDRVEVVNGDVSSLYGSGAMGGVVQVFTKDGGDHPPQFYASTSYGSYHTQDQNVGMSGRLDADGATTFSIDLSRYKTDGFPAIDNTIYPSVNPAANGYFNESVSAGIKHRFSNGWEVGGTFYQSMGNDSFDNPYGTPTDINLLYSKMQQASIYAQGNFTDWWHARFSVGSGEDRQQDWTLGYDPDGNYVNGAYSDYYNTDNRQYTWQNDFTIAPGSKIQLGYEHLDQAFETNEFNAPQRHVDSEWVGYDGKFLDRLHLQANLRHDQYSDFGGANSYYLGASYDITSNLSAVLSYSDAFGAPTFDELYYPGTANPALQPERSHTVEGALQYASASVGVARLTLFQTDYTNLIQYDPNSTLGMYGAEVNVGQAKVQGIEASWRGQLAGTDLRASVTFQNPVDQDSPTNPNVSDTDAGQDLVRRSRRFASFAASHKFGDFNVGATWLLSGGRLDYNNQGTLSELGGYGVFNLNARYNITKSWYVGASINNLFDQKYETVYGYNTPRVSGFLTIGYQQH